MAERVVAVCLYLVMLVSCDSSSAIELSNYDRVEINGRLAVDKKEETKTVLLSKEQQRILSDFFREFQTGRYAILGEADCIMHGYPSKEDPDTYSLYLKEKIVYKGYFLDAMYEAMHDRSVLCYKMNDDAVKYIKQIMGPICLFDSDSNERVVLDVLGQGAKDPKSEPSEGGKPRGNDNR